MKRSPSLFPILAVIFTNMLGASMVLPILPLYATETFGASEFQAALLTSAFFGAQFLASPWLGQLSDRLGRRPVLMGSQFGTFLAFLLFVYAEEIGTALDVSRLSIGMAGGMLVLFFARILDGITGGNVSAAQAYISDISNRKLRTQSLGLLSAAMGIGFIIGPALGGLLAGMGVKAPFIGAAVITLGTMIITFFTLEESLPVEKRMQKGKKVESFALREMFSNRNLLLLILLGFLSFSAFAAFPPTFSLYMDKVIFPEINNAAKVAQRVGWILMASGFYSVLTQAVLIRPLIKFLGERRLVLLGFTTWAAGMFIFPLIKIPWVIALAIFPYAFSRGVIDPSLQSLVTSFSSEQTHGRMLGIYQSARSMAMIIGPIWAGWVFTSISPASVYTVSGLILLVGCGVALVLQRISTGTPDDVIKPT